jgi:hypothetical protein
MVFDYIKKNELSNGFSSFTFRHVNTGIEIKVIEKCAFAARHWLNTFLVKD